MTNPYGFFRPYSLTPNQMNIWRSDYERSRYLRELPTQALTERLRQLTKNLWTTSCAGEPILINGFLRRQWWLRLIYDCLLEQSTKNSDNQFIFDEAQLMELSVAISGYESPNLKSALPNVSNCLWKFGNKKHILNAFKYGSLKIGPAGTYKDDPSLSEGQKDDELFLSTRTPNMMIPFELGMTDDKGQPIKATPAPLELHMATLVKNFYVWCCSNEYDARMFREFGDAALIILDPREFSIRLQTAVRKAKPNYIPIPGTKGVAVKYYDPHLMAEANRMPTPIVNKLFEYAYQSEHRFAWQAEQEETFSNLFVDIGPLDDIAQVVETVSA